MSEGIGREERGSIANVEEGKEKYRRERTDTEAIRRPDKQSDRQTNIDMTAFGKETPLP